MILIAVLLCFGECRRIGRVLLREFTDLRKIFISVLNNRNHNFDRVISTVIISGCYFYLVRFDIEDQLTFLISVKMTF